MDDSLFNDFSFPFAYKPLLFAGKALEYHGVRAGNEYDLLLPQEEFRSLWHHVPEQRFQSPTGHQVVHIAPFAFYEHWFGYDYWLLARESIDRADYRVMPLMMLAFFTLVHVTHEPENTQAKHDLVALMQQLGVWPMPSGDDVLAAPMEAVSHDAAPLDATFEEIKEITVTRLAPEVLHLLRQSGCTINERGLGTIQVTFPERTRRQPLLPPTAIERSRIVLAGGLELRHEIDRTREMSLLAVVHSPAAPGGRQ